MKDKILKKVLVRRNPTSNKSSFGHALLITGSQKYPGATHIAIKSALYGGAGYIDLFCSEVPNYLVSSVPEVIYTLKKDFKQKGLKPYTAILFGNGLLSSDKDTQGLLDYLLQNYTKRLIIDATGLQYLKNFYSRYHETKVAPQIIITPHIKEFCDLVNINVESSDPCFYESEIDKYLNEHPRTVIVLKSYKTLIKSINQRYIIDKPNSGLAKAGSGDALAGLMVSLMAYNTSHNIDIAYAACKIMSIAAHNLNKKISSASFTATKVTEEIPYILKSYIK